MMWLFLIFKMLSCVFCLPRRLFSVCEMMVGTKMERFFILGTKSGKNKKYGPKWECVENVWTKIVFTPLFIYWEK